MTNATLTTASFTLSIASGAVTGTVNVSGNTARFTPSALLAASTQYTATITTAVKDSAGNALTNNYSWNFTTTATAPGTTYITNFDQTENPISDGGRWTNGRAVGLDWNDMQSASSNAYGTAFSPANYDDNIACLSGFAANHYVEGVIYRAAGYNPSQEHEIELLVRFQITAHNARGNEILINSKGGNQIVRWNGGQGDFTVLSTSGNGTGNPVNGDVIRVEVRRNSIIVKKNGTQVLSATDSTWTNGNPGIAVFSRGADDVLANFGWSSITAGDL